MTHICVSKSTIIGSDNGLSPGRRQAIIWTNAGILLIRTLATNFSKILGKIHSFSFSEIHLKMSSAKWRLFGLGLNELMGHMSPGSDRWGYCPGTMSLQLFWKIGHPSMKSTGDRPSEELQRVDFKIGTRIIVLVMAFRWHALYLSYRGGCDHNTALCR